MSSENNILYIKGGQVDKTLECGPRHYPTRQQEYCSGAHSLFPKIEKKFTGTLVPFRGDIKLSVLRDLI